MIASSLPGRVMFGLLAVCGTVGWAIGIIAAVTEWIPHVTGGDTLGSIGMYLWLAVTAGLTAMLLAGLTAEALAD